MKNFSTGLSIAALLGVVVLFYLHFSGKGNAAGSSGTKAVPSGNFKIAYFESDSIQNNFEYFKEIRASLQAKDQANSKQLNELKSIFASKYQDLQKSGNMLSQAELANKQQELAQLEKTYQGKEQMMAQEMQDESFKKITGRKEENRRLPKGV